MANETQSLHHHPDVGNSFIFILPFVFMFFASFKREAEVLNPSAILPDRWDLTNYQAAFAIARTRIRGGRILLNIVVGAMMVPAQLFLIPLYIILSRLGLLDTPYSMILPAAAGGFGVFMLSQFMRGILSAIEETALMDGCTLAQLFWRITLPLCAPSIATLAVFTFVASWNDYITPLVFMESVNHYTLPVGIALFQSSYSTQYGLTIATSLIVTAPLVVMFLVFQRQIIESMASSGLKD